MKNIIHLSHTDIRYDSRIIKEMLALSKAYPSYRIQGLGIKLSENEDLKVTFKDYYFSNVIARASKTMLDCNNSKLNIKRTGTEG